MRRREIEEWVELLERRIDSLLETVRDTHRICEYCNITGHKIDMKEVWDQYGHVWYHNGCYAVKFNKHLCPCGCGKWLDDKKKGHK